VGLLLDTIHSYHACLNVISVQRTFKSLLRSTGMDSSSTNATRSSKSPFIGESEQGNQTDEHSSFKLDRNEDSSEGSNLKDTRNAWYEQQGWDNLSGYVDEKLEPNPEPYTMELKRFLSKAVEETLVSVTFHKCLQMHYASLGHPVLWYYRNKWAKRLCRLYRKGQFLEPLREAFERYFIFHFQHIHPILVQSGVLTEMEWNEELQVTALTCQSWVSSFLYTSVCEPVDKCTEYGLLERYGCGLLRAQQVRLVEFALDAHRKELAEVVSAHLVNRTRLPTDKTRYHDGSSFEWDAMSGALSYTFGIDCMQHFVCDARFRSERLELLLLQYIDDGVEVNMEVVEGVKAAQQLYMRASLCRHNTNIDESQLVNSCCIAKEDYFRASKWNVLGRRRVYRWELELDFLKLYQ
jgi:hypothetical protein